MAKRVRLGLEQWRELVSRQKQSGLSVSAFCVREGVGVASFYLWRSKLTEGGSVKDRPMTKLAASFVDLGSLAPALGAWSIRLELGDGVVLHLSR